MWLAVPHLAHGALLCQVVSKHRWQSATWWQGRCIMHASAWPQAAHSRGSWLGSGLGSGLGLANPLPHPHPHPKPDPKQRVRARLRARAVVPTRRLATSGLPEQWRPQRLCAAARVAPRRGAAAAQVRAARLEPRRLVRLRVGVGVNQARPARLEARRLAGPWRAVILWCVVRGRCADVQ